MVPRLSIISCRVMPMPSSEISRVLACLSGTMRILASAGGAKLASVSDFEPAAIHRVRRVGHQLPQEYLPLGIERVHHQIEQAPDLGAK